LGRKIFRELTAPSEALELIRRFFRVGPLGVEEVPVEEAVGRVLAEDVVAPIDLPPFDSSAVDGYAVRSSDLEGADELRPVELRLVGEARIGEPPPAEVGAGKAVEVSTGSPLPKGADSVVMVEYVKGCKGSILVTRPTVPGEGIVYASSYVTKGEVVLIKGTRLTYREVGLLASLGLRRVKVFRRPKVAIISTGNELVEPGRALEYGKVYDANSYLLHALVASVGGEPEVLGLFRDEAEELRRALMEAAERYDVVIASGGTSSGPGDLMYRVIEELGELVLHGLRLKPGKPTAVGALRGKPVFALPGYPLSCAMAFKVLVAPLIAKMAGVEASPSPRRKVEVAVGFEVAAGRYNLIPAVLSEVGGKFKAYPLLTGSGDIKALTLADGFLIVEPERRVVERGEEVGFEPLLEPLRIADLIVIGSHCPGLEASLTILRRRSSGLSVKSINVGSMGGLKAVEAGCCDVAGIHLLDEETGTYNIPFVERYGLRGRAVLVRGYLREQGLIVAKGNPKGIKGVEDLLRDDVSFVNRNRGSGTRALLELLLRELSEERDVGVEELRGAIKGYEVEVKTHTAVALAVKYGRADAGLGVRAAAELYGLDFVPLRWEEYDFLISKPSLDKPSAKLFLKVLRDTEFKRALEKLKGLRALQDTGEVVYA